MAIPRGLIRKMAASNTVYSQGLSLSAAPFSYQTTPTQFVNYYQVTASFPDRHCSTLEIDNEHEWIEKTDCTCSSFAYGKACKHIVALLLKIENDFFSADFARNAHSQAAPETDAGCRQLLAERGEIVKARARQRALFEKAVLLPQISLSGDAVRLGFKAGCGRGYVVRDLEEFYQALLHRKSAPCGRLDDFLYAPESFHDEELVRFFMAYYPFCRESESSKTMTLTPEALDAFFILFNERKIATDSGMLTLTADIPAFILWIKPSPQFYRLSLDRRGFEVLKGREQLYIKEENKLYLCGVAFSDVCGGLISRFADKDSDPIILREDMTAFYSLVLKPAARFIQIRSDVRDFIPPALKTRIYLDAHEKSVTARTEFYYDETMYYAFSLKRDLQTVWDIEGETLIENLVKSYFPEPGNQPGTAVLTADNDSLFRLISEGIPALSRHAVLYISTSLKNVQLKSFSAPKMGVRVESGLLKLDVSSVDFPPAVLAAALAAYRQKKKYIRLKDGSFLLLDNDAMMAFSNVADGTGLSATDFKKQDLSLPAYRALYLDSVADVMIVKDKSLTELIKAFTAFEREDFSVPVSLDGVLRDYQKIGFRWLLTLSRYGFGGILADDMGLGKTIQVLSLLTSHKENHGACRALVVCPASLVLNWEHETMRFAQSLRPLCILGSNSERQALLAEAQDYDLLITSYDLLKRDIASYQDMQFDFEIIDEAQYIKNHNTQNARSVKAINAQCRFALTGTPIENSIAELWSIFDYLMPGYLYKYARFRQRFEIPIVRDGDTAALRELKKMIAPFILRRLKRDVLKELPEKTESVLYAKLAPEQNKLYKANLASMQKDLATDMNLLDSGQNRLMVLAMLTRLRQLCCDPALLYENYREKSAKLELCMNLVEASVSAGHKLLIFSQFTTMLHLIGQQLKHRQLAYYLIEGATKTEDRLAQVSAFNQDDTPVFLISLKAGGTGLNLTGADVVIHYDPWWNLSAQNQATDRAHRIGQKNSVSVYKLITKDTIEEKILALAEKKQSLAENILPDENGLLKGMTREQILDLFRS